MFDDDTKLLYSHPNIKTELNTVYIELSKINSWF